MTIVADSKVSSAKSGECPWVGLGPAGAGHKWVVTWFWGRVWAAGGTIVDDSKVWNPHHSNDKKLRKSWKSWKKVWKKVEKKVEKNDEKKLKKIMKKNT